MELGHLMTSRRFCTLLEVSRYSTNSSAQCLSKWKKQGALTYVYFHLLVDSVVHNQAMGQPDSMRLHGMPSNVGIISNIRVVEVRNSFLITGLENDIVDGRRNIRHVCGFGKWFKGIKGSEGRGLLSDQSMIRTSERRKELELMLQEAVWDSVPEQKVNG
jgi:hypothetical protein